MILIASCRIAWLVNKVLNNLISIIVVAFPTTCMIKIHHTFVVNSASTSAIVKSVAEITKADVIYFR